MALVVREGSGCWHVYQTEPWVLVTAFPTREEAAIYVEHGRIRSEPFDVTISSWCPTVLQESFSCVLCKHRLSAGVLAYVRTLRVRDDDRIDLRFEAKCLDHPRSRFDRDDPL